jgi:hypothetical protein
VRARPQIHDRCLLRDLDMERVPYFVVAVWVGQAVPTLGQHDQDDGLRVCGIERQTQVSDRHRGARTFHHASSLPLSRRGGDLRPDESGPQGTGSAESCVRILEMLLRRLITAAMAAIVLDSCTGDGRPAGYAEDIFFPTYPRSPDGAYPAALLAEVMLVESDECLFAVHPEVGRFLLLWPEGYAPVRRDGRLAVVDEEGNVIAKVGHRHSFGGGTSGLGVARYFTGRDVPVRCRVDGTTIGV